jgi:hypothetical protein
VGSSVTVLLRRIDRRFDINGNAGGPAVRSKAWFFFSYRLNDQNAVITGFDPRIVRYGVRWDL